MNREGTRTDSRYFHREKYASDYASLWVFLLDPRATCQIFGGIDNVDGDAQRADDGGRAAKEERLGVLLCLGACMWGGERRACAIAARARALPSAPSSERSRRKPRRNAYLLRFPPCLRRVPCPHSHTALRTQAMYHTAPLGGGGGAGFAVRADSAVAAPARGLADAVGGLKVKTPKSQCRSVFTIKSLTANMPKRIDQS